MVYGVGAVKAVLGGAAGVAGLYTATNTVNALVKGVCRALATATAEENAPVKTSKKEMNVLPSLRTFSPFYSGNESLRTIVIRGTWNAVAALVSLYVLNRYAPSAVSHANKIIGYVAPIKFTAENFALGKLVRLF